MVRAPNQPELHEREQYFFNAETVRAWTAVARSFENPCLLCVPTVGAELRGTGATVLDLDERFSFVSGFQRWDLAAPARLAQRFGVILCDPPFFAVSLSRLGDALDVLASHDPSQPLAITYLKRREAALLRALDRFQLRPTGARPGYWTVSGTARNEIEVYANFDWATRA